MQVNKAVMFSLIVAFLVMTLLSTLSTVDLSEKQSEQEQSSQELRIAREMLDDQIQLLIEELDKRKALQKQLDEYKQKEQKQEVATQEAPTSRGEINNYDISRPSGRTSEELEKLVMDTSLKGLGIAFYEAEQTYGINGIFIAAVARLESGNGITYLAKTKNNLFGLNAWGKSTAEINRRAYSYSSKHACVLAFAKIIRENYIDKGRNTIKTISDIYCEKPTYWCNKITNLLELNIKILNE